MRIKGVLICFLLLLSSIDATQTSSLVHTLDMTLSSILNPPKTQCEIQAKQDSCLKGDNAGLKMAKSTAMFASYNDKPYAFGVDMLKNWLLTIPKHHELDHSCLRHTFEQLYPFYFQLYQNSKGKEKTCAVPSSQIEVPKEEKITIPQITNTLNIKTTALKNMKNFDENNFEEIEKLARKLATTNRKVCALNQNKIEALIEKERENLKGPKTFLQTYLKIHDYAGVKRVLSQLQEIKDQISSHEDTLNQINNSLYCKHSEADFVQEVTIQAKKDMMASKHDSVTLKKLKESIKKDSENLKILQFQVKAKRIKSQNKKLEIRIRNVEDLVDREKDCQKLKDLRSELSYLRSLKQKVPKQQQKTRNKKSKDVKKNNKNIVRKWSKEKKTIWKKKHIETNSKKSKTEHKKADTHKESKKEKKEEKHVKTKESKKEKKIEKEAKSTKEEHHDIEHHEEHHKYVHHREIHDKKGNHKKLKYQSQKRPAVSILEDSKTSCEKQTVNQVVEQIKQQIQKHKANLTHLFGQKTPKPCKCCSPEQKKYQARIKLLKNRIQSSLKKKEKRVEEIKSSLMMASLV